MPSLNSRGRQYWRSLDDVADTPEFRQFMHHEFPAGAAELLDSGERRHFLKIMAASMALAGLGISGCRRWPKEQIAPYANRPVGRIPGNPLFYSTCMSVAGSAAGLLVTSMDGRPIKVDGNPEHPINRGASDVFAQASVLGLYDPDRSRTVRHDGEPSTWPAFLEAMQADLTGLKNARGSGLHVLSEAVDSPSLQAMRQRLLEAFPQARWHEYEPLANDNEIRGAEIAFGEALRPQLDLTRARVIASFDDDFMFGGTAVKSIRDFAAGRRAPQSSPADKRMNRLYCFESAHSLTGANADHRVSMKSADVARATAWLASRVLDDPTLDPGAAGLSAEAVEALQHLLDDLRHHRGESVVTAGPRQPAAVHALVHAINRALENAGSTVGYTSLAGVPAHAASLAALAAAMEGNRVQTLLILGGNPVYTAPADLDFAARLAGVRQSVHLSEHDDETSQACRWHVNRAHYLESWGDGRAADGTLTLGQPLIRPLFGGVSAIELLAALTGDDATAGEQIVRRTFQEMTGSSDPDRPWRRTLHDGLLPGSAYTIQAPPVDLEAVAAAAASLPAASGADAGGLEVVFTGDYSVLDGRFANNGWLQELPDPLTKLTWDNAAILGPRTARELDVDAGDMIRITLDGRSVEAAAFVLPGQAEGSLTLPLGYGRSFEGRICTGAGFDFYPLRTMASMGFAGGATVEKTGERYPLATTQDHHALDMKGTGGAGIDERLPSIVREGTLEEYRRDPEFARHRAHVVHRLSLWNEDNLAGGRYRWAMSIDLSACVGCNACVTACQAENNIPIVGKDQVTRGREMHWIRVDRYFKFAHDEHGRPDPEQLRGTALQPVPCMQCENAPCEQVCPVAATVHDKDGLNVMVYNRCVGTRYCSNNCPYKVRRFNYFDYHRRDPARAQPGTLLQVDPTYYTRPQAGPDPLRQLQFNPEVSVRVRGVMEKCTYCVQRIQAARIEAKNEWVKLPADDPRRAVERVPVADGAIQTACQQACPAEAIVFGDLSDPDSRVSKLHASGRSYQLLEELNVKARTRYLAKLRNPGYGEVAAEASHH